MEKIVASYRKVKDQEKDFVQHDLSLLFAEDIIRWARAARHGEVNVGMALMHIQGLADNIAVSLKLEPPFLKPGDF